MKIKEIIVVEGKDDTVAVRRAVNADTIETNGSAINEETIEKIKLAQSFRGVIVLTDPDFPGEKIRNAISEAVPNCKHAFIDKASAIEKRGKGVGVEYATPEIIRAALADAHQMKQEAKEIISAAELHWLGLTGGSGSKEKRQKIGKILKIGYANGKQLHSRLMQFGITEEQFRKALSKIYE